MNFEDLVGNHILSGVEEKLIEISDCWGNVSTNSIIIQLDGKNYAFIEDPDDGYRSYCRDPEEVAQEPKYKLPNIPVNITVFEEGNGWAIDRYLIFTDINNDKEILRIGTQDYNDWYPCCRFEWHPENLFINQHL